MRSGTRIAAGTTLAMFAFACNSLLCRLALKSAGIDAASFTTIRLASGAAALWLIASMRRGARTGRGDARSAQALFVYAAGFSFAYVSLPASTGALLLFGAVQATMIGHGLRAGERLRGWQIVGLVLALGGLAGLLAPGLTAPPLQGSMLMLIAGVAWGIYSLRGKAHGDPLQVTARNFALAVPMAFALSVVLFVLQKDASLTEAGILYAMLSGAVASGLGYAVWYSVLPALRSTQAATVQLSVPVLAAAGGVLVLGEHVTPRLLLASVSILGGIALVILERRGAVA